MIGQSLVRYPISTDPAPGRARVRDPERKSRILAAAADLVARNGFHAVSISQIGNAAGITGSGVYRHFDSKSAVLVALFDRVIDDLMRENSTLKAKLEDLARAMRGRARAGDGAAASALLELQRFFARSLAAELGGAAAEGTDFKSLTEREDIARRD